MKPTMQDVADLAQVSRATVSRVLADSTQVSQDKRSIVMAAVEKLGYKPHKKTHSRAELLVCVATNSNEDPFIDEIIAGIEAGTQIAKAKILFQYFKEETMANPEKQMRSQLETAEGIIICGNIDLANQSGLPLAMIHGVGNGENCSYIGIEERKTMIEIIHDLVSFGHRKIAYIHGPERDQNYQERLRAFKLGLLSAGISVDNRMIIHADNWDQKSGFAATKKLLSVANPTAIVAATDQLALGAYQNLEEMGFEVPQDLSIVGFGDLGVKLGDILLSSVAVSFSSLGKWAVTSLCAQISDPEIASVRLLVPTVYRRRQSVSQARQI